MTTDPSALRRRRRRLRRAVLAVVLLVILVPLAAAAIFVARFDPNTYKPEIVAAFEKATGRTLALNGPLSLGLSLVPTISATKVVLANPPGFTRPDMATFARLDATVALLPLLSGRLEIRRLDLVRPDIGIEINRAGQSNLSITGSASSAAPTAPAAAPTAARSARPVTIEVRAVAITDGRFSWQNDRTGGHAVLDLRSFTATSPAAGAPLAIKGSALYGGVPFTLTGTTGPLSRLTAPAGAAPAAPPWPVTLDLLAGPAKLTLAGSLAEPAAGRGYRFDLHATLPALETLAPLVRGMKLPPLRTLALSAQIADAGHGLTDISNLSLSAGASNLSALRPGLLLTALQVTAPRLDQPCKFTLAGSLSGAPFDVAATLGPPASLLPAGIAPAPPAAPWPIALHATAAGADLSVSGTIGDPPALAGVALAVTAHVPALAGLDPFAGRSLPALSHIAFSGKLSDAASGWRQWVRLSALSLTLPEGDLSGDASLALAGPRPLVTATLTSKRIDLDALRKVLAAIPPTPSGKPAAAASPAPPVAPSAGPARLIPDTPLPFALLNAIDADLRFAVGTLNAGGAAYGNLDGRLALKNGQLSLAPFGADSPGGHLALTATIDAALPSPRITMTLDAPALALSPLLASFGLPSGASGTLAVRAAFQGSGTSPHAIAGGLNGRLGIAMAGGSIQNSVITSLLGSVFRAARLPSQLLGNGTSQIRCFALRLDSTGGIGRLNALLLEMDRLTLAGGGELAFGPETLSLELDPTVQYGTTALTLPVHVSGTFLAPRITPAPAGTAGSVAGVVGNLAHPQGALGQILQALRGKTQAAPPDCAPALALARFGAPGPAAPAGAAVPAPSSGPAGSAPAAKPNSPLNLLRGLFH